METADQVFETNISIGNDLHRSEDQFYSSAIHLTDEAILSLKTAMEENRLKEDQFYFLSYLLSRPALSLKDVTVICLSLFTDGLSTTTPTILFNLYCLATWPEVQQRVYNEIAEQVKKQSGHFFRKWFVRCLMRSWSHRKLLPGLPCHVQYNDKEFQGCRPSRLLWKRRSGCGQMGLRCRATVSRCGIEEAGSGFWC